MISQFLFTFLMAERRFSFGVGFCWALFDFILLPGVFLYLSTLGRGSLEPAGQAGSSSPRATAALGQEREELERCWGDEISSKRLLQKIKVKGKGQKVKDWLERGQSVNQLGESQKSRLEFLVRIPVLVRLGICSNTQQQWEFVVFQTWFLLTSAKIWFKSQSHFYQSSHCLSKQIFSSEKLQL